MQQVPGATPFDLRWTMFGINVRVHPMFWLITAGMGYIFRVGGGDLSVLLLWVACVFVSILLHELGHVLAGRMFGSHGNIVLWGFGGFAIGATDVPQRWQRILVIFAGPGAQLFMVPAIQFAMDSLPPGSNIMFSRALLYLYLINLYWPIINLLPIYPLDGGQIVREICEWIARRTGTIVSLVISIIAGSILTADFVARSQGYALLTFVSLPVGIYTAIFMVMFVIRNVQELSTLSADRPRRRNDEEDEYDRDRDFRSRSPRRYEEMPWERPDGHVRKGSDDGVRRGSDDGYQRGPDDGYRKKDDELPWER